MRTIGGIYGLNGRLHRLAAWVHEKYDGAFSIASRVRLPVNVFIGFAVTRTWPKSSGDSP
jgi:hypothetical protein